MQHRPRPAERDRDDDDHERRRGEAADPPAPEVAQVVAPRPRALVEQQRGDQEAAEREEQRHPEEAAAHRVDPRGRQCVEQHDAGDGDAAQSVEGRLVGDETVASASASACDAGRRLDRSRPSHHAHVRTLRPAAVRPAEADVDATSRRRSRCERQRQDLTPDPAATAGGDGGRAIVRQVVILTPGRANRAVVSVRVRGRPAGAARARPPRT